MSVTLLIEGIWVALAAIAVALQVTALVRPGFPGFTDVVAVATRGVPGRVLLLGTWAWLGWHFFVRAH